MVSWFPLYKRDGSGNEVTNPVAGMMGTPVAAGATGTTLYTSKDNTTWTPTSPSKIPKSAYFYWIAAEQTQYTNEATGQEVPRT
jgi:hypothetical protein